MRLPILANAIDGEGSVALRTHNLLFQPVKDGGVIPEFGQAVSCSLHAQVIASLQIAVLKIQYPFAHREPGMQLIMIERLDQVFKKLGKKPSGTDCPAIDGLIKEANQTSSEVEDKSVLDAAIVANAQAVEHYEISRYGTLIAWAEELGHDDIVRFLNTNLNEEKAANTKLNTVALRKGVNRRAAS